MLKLLLRTISFKVVMDKIAVTRKETLLEWFIIITNILSKLPDTRERILKDGILRWCLILREFGDDESICKSAFTLLRRLFLRKSEIKTVDVIEIIKTLKLGDFENQWGKFDRDAMEILYIISSNYLPLLIQHMDDLLHYFIKESYKSKSQPLRFLSVAVLGNIMSVETKADSEKLSVLDPTFIKICGEIFESQYVRLINDVCKILLKISKNHPGKVSFP